MQIAVQMEYTQDLTALMVMFANESPLNSMIFTFALLHTGFCSVHVKSDLGDQFFDSLFFYVLKNSWKKT